jgi:hypothetical protein
MYCVFGLEVRVHVVFCPTVGGTLLISWNVCDSHTIVNSITRVDALGHALRTERLEVATAIVPIADKHPF